MTSYPANKTEYSEMPYGSKNGKDLFVRSRNIQDPETGDKYTIKIYRSKKTETQDSLSQRSIPIEPV